MELKAKVHEVGTTNNVSDTFKKRDVILEYSENPSYPEYLKFDLLQDKCDLANDLKPGDEVEVLFNLRGRPWTNKEGVTTYFNSLVIWRISKLSASNVQQQPKVDLNTSAGEEDDLPF